MVGPHPLPPSAGPTSTRGQGSGSDLRIRLVGLDQPGKVLAGLQGAHAQQERARRRPCGTAGRRPPQVGGRQVVGPHGDDRDGLRGGAGLARSAATTSAGTMNRSAPPQGAAQGRLVPGPAAGRVGLGHPAPQQVVHRGHQGGAPRLEGGERGGLDHVEPGPGPQQAVVPGPGEHGPGQRGAVQRMAQLGQGVGRPDGRRRAGWPPARCRAARPGSSVSRPWIRPRT